MTALNISLPKPMKEYVEAQVRAGGYSTPSEYMRALLREDQKRKAEEQLEALLLEGLKSGKPTEVTSAYWEQKRRQLLKGRQKRNSR